MFLVVDVNVIFSALIKKGKPFEVFESNKIFGTFDFITPEFLFSELDKDTDRLLSFTSLSLPELKSTLFFLKKEITIIPSSSFLDKLQEAKNLNEKDAPYLALALKMNCPVLSGDKRLKEQKKVSILSPAEALEMIYSSTQK